MYDMKKRELYKNRLFGSVLLKSVIISMLNEKKLLKIIINDFRYLNNESTKFDCEYNKYLLKKYYIKCIAFAAKQGIIMRKFFYITELITLYNYQLDIYSNERREDRWIILRYF